MISYKLTCTGSTYYYHSCSTHNNIRLRETLVTHRNANTGMQERNGTGAKSQAAAWINVAISAAGIGSTSVSIFSGGLSLLEAFTVSKGPVTSSSVQDRVSGNLIYDAIQKRPEAEIMSGHWAIGKYSTKAWLNRIDVYAFFESRYQ